MDPAARRALRARSGSAAPSTRVASPGGGVGPGAAAGVRGGGIDRLERRPAAPVAAEVDGDLEEPGREATPRVEAARRAHHPQPRLLVEVLDITPPGVPGDELVERALVAPAELLQPAPVAARDRRDQLLVGRHPRPRGAVSCERPPRHGAGGEITPGGAVGGGRPAAPAPQA